MTELQTPVGPADAAQPSRGRNVTSRQMLVAATLFLWAANFFIFTTPGLDAPSEKVDAEMGPKIYYSGLGIPGTLALAAEAGCICRHLEYDQHPDARLHRAVHTRPDARGGRCGAARAGR